MSERLKGKVVMITGASRGIGKALAVAFAREGARLALCSSSAEAAAVAADLEQSGAVAWGSSCDVADAQQVGAFVTETLRRYGGIDLLINNAAVLGPRRELTDCSAADFRRVLDVNLMGAVHLTQAVAGAMKARRAGCILNLTSGAGRQGRKLAGPYGVSKLALEGLTQIAAAELKEHGIRVYAINPGPTRTAMRRDYAPQEDPAKVKPPETLGEAFIRIACDETGNLAGRSLDLGEDGEIKDAR